MAYKHFEHLADIGIIGIGKTLDEAFEEAAKAMFSIMAEIKMLKKEEEVKFEVSAENTEELFIEFLNELLSLSDLKGIMFSDFNVRIEKNKLRGTAYGEKTSEDMNLKTEVKAATFSQLEIKKENGKFVAKTIVDL